MATEKRESIEATVRRLLAERLMEYDVPGPVISEIRDEIMVIVNTPEKKPYGAAVMTQEASINENQRPKIV